MEQNYNEYIIYWKNHLLNGKKNILYIDIPFCTQRCDFCIFDSNVLKNDKELETYILERIIPQVVFFNDVFDDVIPDVLYFGGGTASLLSEEQINSICNKIKNFDKIETKAFEAHPDSMSVRKLEVLLRKGFNYFSFGVQTFDGLILNQIHRKYVSPDHMKNLVELIHVYDAIVSVDLIAYLIKWDKKEINITKKDLEILTRQVKPNCITIHMNYKKYSQTEEVGAVFKVVKDILLTTDYYTNVPDRYASNYNYAKLGCYTHNIYHGDFKTICKAKAYNCSGPGGFPDDQNVFAIGGHGTRFPYSYIEGRQWYIGGVNKEIDIYEVTYNSLHCAVEFLE